MVPRDRVLTTLCSEPGDRLSEKLYKTVTITAEGLAETKQSR